MSRPTSLFFWLALFFLFAAFTAHAQDAIKPPRITLTTIAVPGYAITEANGINSSGEIVGAYGPSTSGPLSGFIYRGGVFTSFDYPGQQVTFPGGINDSGLIVGYATQDAGQQSTVVGFVYDGANFTTLQDGKNGVTHADGINNAGTVVGSAGPDLDVSSAFEEENGQYKPIRLPGTGCPYEFANGINNLGEIVADTACGLYLQGYAVLNGKARSLAFPGAIETVALGINDSGVIVGWYGENGHENAFAYFHGKYISFSYPGVNYTYATGINNSGQIAGSYNTISNAWYGFVSSPITAADFERSGCCRVAIVEGK